MNEQKTEENNTQANTLEDLEAQNAEEIKGSGLTKVGPGTLILPNHSDSYYGTGVYK